MQMPNKLCVGKEWRKGGREERTKGGRIRGRAKRVEKGKTDKAKEEGKSGVGEQKRGE